MEKKDTVFVEGITRDQLWETINENSMLKQENYMLKAQLEQIRRVLRSE
jgi:regulator of replication initiation timing